MQTVIIIDDSEDDRFFFRRVMKKKKPETDLYEFSYAEDALSFLRSPGRPEADLLVVDINMPRMDGFEFANAYLQLYPELRGSAPIFISSSSLNPEDEKRAKMHPSVSGFIKKPITRESIEEIFSAAAS